MYYKHNVDLCPSCYDKYHKVLDSEASNTGCPKTKLMGYVNPGH